MDLIGFGAGANLAGRAVCTRIVVGGCTSRSAPSYFARNLMLRNLEASGGQSGPGIPIGRIAGLSRRQYLLAEYVVPVLRLRGYHVDLRTLTPDVADDLHIYDLVVLEAHADDMEAILFCGQLREYSKVPLLLVVPMSARSHAIQGLELGADSFMLMPFDRRELIARAEALIRRYRTY